MPIFFQRKASLVDRVSFGILVFCMLLATAVGTQAADVPTSKDQRIAREDFLVHVHRGAGCKFSENTLEACQKSWRQLGAIPECDVRKSKDGVYYAFHDGDLARVVKDVPHELKGRKVNAMTWPELSRLDVGAFRGPEFAGHHIPKIADVFAAMQGHPRRLVCLDFKTGSLAELAALAKKYGVEKQIVFTTNQYDLIRQWKKLSPASQTMLWMGGKQEALAQKIDILRKADFKDLTQLQIHVQVGDFNTADPFSPSTAFLQSVIDEVHKRKIIFVAFPWASQDRRTFDRLLQMGVDAFSTDYPDEVQQIVDNFYRK